jgi:putative mRNA 3-end processing factor
MNSKSSLLELTSIGLYCRDADVYLDPWRPVARALVTHAHADHARPGSSHYLTHHTGMPLLHARLGTRPEQVEGVHYGEVRTINGISFSFHPAGHVPGSAQILVERNGERWVFSGDYKLESDGVSTPFEPVRCNVFISECTFGLPIFSWRPQEHVFADIHSWWRDNREKGISSVLCAYSLGKAQRVIKHLDLAVGPVFVHPSVWGINEALGLTPAGVQCATGETRAQGALVIAPPAVIGSPWLRRFGPHEVGVVSGWMAIRGIRRRRGVERGFVLSDHADFAGLNTAVRATEAERVLLTHGYTAHFARWLCSLGLAADELKTDYGEEHEGHE